MRDKKYHNAEVWNTLIYSSSLWCQIIKCVGCVMSELAINTAVFKGKIGHWSLVILDKIDHF